MIRLSAVRDADVAVARAETAAVLARETDAALYPNPSLAWEREHFPAGEGSREDSFVVTVPIDVSGRRSARMALARSDTHGASAREARTRSAATLRALETFYAALVADARVEVEQRTARRLGELVRVLARRQEEGTASGYDLIRLEVELELAGSELRRVEVEAEALRSELMLLLALDALPSELRGELAGASPSTGAERGNRPPPSLEMTRASARDARDAVESARSAWVPVIAVRGGLKATDSDTTRYGYVAGVVLDLPVFSRGQELDVLVRAEERLAAVRRQAAERALRFEAVSAAKRLSRAREELLRFDKGTGERLERLGRASETGYREGTRSVTELLDAERARAEIELRKLELLAAAKRAELALRAARGEFE